MVKLSGGPYEQSEIVVETNVDEELKNLESDLTFLLKQFPQLSVLIVTQGDAHNVLKDVSFELSLEMILNHVQQRYYRNLLWQWLRG